MIKLQRVPVSSSEAGFQDKIEQLRGFLFDIVKPSVSEYIEMHDPESFIDSWKRNCCLQTSLITSSLLRELLVDTNAGYLEVQSWHGNFTDVMFGKRQNYNHAWNYCVHSDPSKNLFIDIGRNHKPLICTFTPFNQYPDAPGYEDMVLLNREKLDVDDMMAQNEYFTGKPGELIIKEIKFYINLQQVA